MAFCAPATMPYATATLPVMLRYLPGGQLRRRDLVGVAEHLGGLAEVQAGLERRRVGVVHHLLLAEALVVPRDRGLDRPRVHPRDQAEGEEVLRALRVTRLHPELLARLERERGHRHLDHAVRVERAVVERVGDVADLVEVALVEGVLVDEDRRPDRHLGQVGLERRGVHRDEHVGRVARRDDVVGADVHLERRHAGDGARRGTDLRRVVRHRREVVAEQRAGVGEPIAGELHPVAGVAGEADDDTLETFGLDGCGGLWAHASLTSLCGQWRFRCRSPISARIRVPGGGSGRLGSRRL